MSAAKVIGPEKRSRHLLFVFAGDDHFELRHEVDAAAQRQTRRFILKAENNNNNSSSTLNEAGSPSTVRATNPFKSQQSAENRPGQNSLVG